MSKCELERSEVFRAALEKAREAARRRDELTDRMRAVEKALEKDKARLAEVERALRDAERAAAVATGEDRDAALAEIARLRVELETLRDMIPRVERQYSTASFERNNAVALANKAVDDAISCAVGVLLDELAAYLAKDRVVRRLVARLHVAARFIPGAKLDLDDPLPAPSEAELEEAERWCAQNLGELRDLRRLRPLAEAA